MNEDSYYIHYCESEDKILDCFQLRKKSDDLVVRIHFDSFRRNEQTIAKFCPICGYKMRKCVVCGCFLENESFYAGDVNKSFCSVCFIERFGDPAK